MSQNGQSSSSSSSAHNTSSSLSSGGTLSSMETLPTQDAQDMIDGEVSEDEKTVVWGRLYPVGTTFRPLDLEDGKMEYLFGRDSECDVPYTSTEMARNMCFLQISKRHFRIYKEVKDQDTFTFIEDFSSNGTFVNGQKIGKGKKRPLVNNDEIALALPKNKAYIFVNTTDSEQETLPPAMKDKYILSKLLGRGACGLVKLAFEKDSCRRVAVKIIETKQFSIGGSTLKDMHNTVMQEVDIIKSLHHPCIIKVEDVYHTDTKLFIVLELVEGGELFDKVVSCGKFPENVAKMLFYQMLVACKYLHDNGITHRDLKPENLLLTADKKEESVIKVTDFGLSKFVGENSLMKTLCGTPTYLAPEILTNAGMGGYTKAVDCWSLGVILFVCLGGYPPFSDEIKVMPLQDQIKRGYYNFPNKWWGAVSEDAKDMIKRLLTVDPKRRMTMSQALKHPWMQDPEAIRWAERLMYPAAQTMPPPAVPISPRKRPISATSEDSNSSSGSSTTSNSSSSDASMKSKVSKVSLDAEDDTTRIINNNSS